MKRIMFNFGLILLGISIGITIGSLTHALDPDGFIAIPIFFVAIGLAIPILSDLQVSITKDR